jgi:hypothetical protein
MAELTGEQKVFIVQRVAAYDSPTQVVRAVKEVFDLDIRRQQVQHYDPYAASSATLGQEMRELFHAERKRFMDNMSQLGIVHRVMRLRRLERYLNVLEDRGNVLGAAAILEQAAKECGDAFTNTRVHTGPGGGPVQAELHHRTDREIAEVIAQILMKVAVEGDGSQPSPPSPPEKAFDA